MIVLQAVVGVLTGFLSLVGLVGVIGLIGMAREKRAERRRQRQRQKQPEPVNAIAENVAWKRGRRVMDAARWDTAFYELEHGEPLPEWARVRRGGAVTGPPREPPTDMIFRRRQS